MRRFALLALWLILALDARAHLLNMSQVQAELGRDGVLALTMTLDLLRANGSPEAYYAMSQSGPDALTAPEYRALWSRLLESIELEQSGARLEIALQRVEPPQAELATFTSNAAWPMTRLVLNAQTTSGAPITLRFRSSFPFEEPIALSFTTSFSEQSKSRWLIANQTSPAFAAEGVVAASQRGIDWRGLSTALWQGVLHVLPGGIDHLLFLLCLFLAIDGWRDRILTITLFTLAHSITLGLAAYRIVELPSHWVEAAIAASILLVALSNLAPGRVHTVRWPLIVCFGLLHGFGFASALRDLDLATDTFLPALLSFNLGVEIGQLIFLAVLSAGLWSFTHRAWYRQRVTLPLSALSALVSGVWLVQRLAQA
ncbi:MAG: HupE/UreJ family protein [Pseudomonadota bacterium]